MMRSNRIAALAAVSFMLTSGVCYSQELTAEKILSNVDNVLYAPKDKDMKVRFVLIDKNGKESIRDLITLEKGADKRLMKFTSPADQKNIGFLSLPGDVMYLYLPAFGKTRRIAAHIKNTKFAGTDLTYENLESQRYSEKWNPTLTTQDESFYHLSLLPKPENKTEYSKELVTVRKDNFYPVKIEFYDKSGNLSKIMTRGKLEKVNNYWESKESVMEDVKSNHKTKLLLLEAKFDTGISDEKFTERYLMQ
jgi:outer membrane lipoprotein-sorting protein